MLKKKFISPATFEKLVPKNDALQERIFYTLPKIDKPQPSWELGGKIPPGRPIIGNTYSEDSEVSKYIDSFLQPFVSQQPHILVNSEQVQAAVHNCQMAPNAYLFTLDVTSIYTNIPLIPGLEVIKHFLQNFLA
jgi:hypothetical protein